MTRTGCLPLDELKAICTAIAALAPFESVSPHTKAVLDGLRLREAALKDDPGLHEALMEGYGMPCRFVHETEFRHKSSGDRRSALTCSNDSCRLFQKPISLDSPVEIQEECRVDDRSVTMMVGR